MGRPKRPLGKGPFSQLCQLLGVDEYDAAERPHAVKSIEMVLGDMANNTLFWSCIPYFAFVQELSLINQDIGPEHLDSIFQRPKVDAKAKLDYGLPEGEPVLFTVTTAAELYIPLPQLRKLNLSENRLTRLPDRFLSLKNLEEVELGCNLLRSLANIFSFFDDLYASDISQVQRELAAERSKQEQAELAAKASAADSAGTSSGSGTASASSLLGGEGNERDSGGESGKGSATSGASLQAAGEGASADPSISNLTAVAEPSTDAGADSSGLGSDADQSDGAVSVDDGVGSGDDNAAGHEDGAPSESPGSQGDSKKSSKENRKSSKEKREQTLRRRLMGEECLQVERSGRRGSILAAGATASTKDASRNTKRKFESRVRVWSMPENRLQSLHGFERLAATLEEVHVARNDVSSLAPLAACRNLQTLNVAGCPLCDLRGATDVLGQLREAHFSDPDYGTCAVAKLQNYLTFVLHWGASLETLDRAPVTPEQRAVASAEYYRKSLFYNARRKFVRRQGTDVRLWATELDVESRLEARYKELYDHWLSFVSDHYCACELCVDDDEEEENDSAVVSGVQSGRTQKLRAKKQTVLPPAHELLYAASERGAAATSFSALAACCSAIDERNSGGRSPASPSGGATAAAAIGSLKRSPAAALTSPVDVDLTFAHKLLLQTLAMRLADLRDLAALRELWAARLREREENLIALTNLEESGSGNIRVERYEFPVFSKLEGIMGEGVVDCAAGSSNLRDTPYACAGGYYLDRDGSCGVASPSLSSCVTLESGFAGAPAALAGAVELGPRNSAAGGGGHMAPGAARLKAGGKHERSGSGTASTSSRTPPGGGPKGGVSSAGGAASAAKTVSGGDASSSSIPAGTGSGDPFGSNKQLVTLGDVRRLTASHPPWAVAAAELIGRRFSVEALADYGVEKVRVKAVTRILHRFAEARARCSWWELKEKKKNLQIDREYLFFVPQRIHQGNALRDILRFLQLDGDQHAGPTSSADGGDLLEEDSRSRGLRSTSASKEQSLGEVFVREDPRSAGPLGSFVVLCTDAHVVEKARLSSHFQSELGQRLTRVLCRYRAEFSVDGVGGGTSTQSANEAGPLLLPDGHILVCALEYQRRPPGWGKQGNARACAAAAADEAPATAAGKDGGPLAAPTSTTGAPPPMSRPSSPPQQTSRADAEQTSLETASMLAAASVAEMNQVDDRSSGEGRATELTNDPAMEASSSGGDPLSVKLEEVAEQAPLPKPTTDSDAAGSRAPAPSAHFAAQELPAAELPAWQLEEDEFLKRFAHLHMKQDQPGYFSQFSSVADEVYAPEPSAYPERSSYRISGESALLRVREVARVIPKYLVELAYEPGGGYESFIASRAKNLKEGGNPPSSAGTIAAAPPAACGGKADSSGSRNSFLLPVTSQMIAKPPGGGKPGAGSGQLAGTTSSPNLLDVPGARAQTPSGGRRTDLRPPLLVASAGSSASNSRSKLEKSGNTSSKAGHHQQNSGAMGSGLDSASRAVQRQARKQDLFADVSEAWGKMLYLVERNFFSVRTLKDIPGLRGMVKKNSLLKTVLREGTSATTEKQEKPEHSKAGTVVGETSTTEVVEQTTKGTSLQGLLAKASARSHYLEVLQLLMSAGTTASRGGDADKNGADSTSSAGLHQITCLEPEHFSDADDDVLLHFYRHGEVVDASAAAAAGAPPGDDAEANKNRDADAQGGTSKSKAIANDPEDDALLSSTPSLDDVSTTIVRSGSASGSVLTLVSQRIVKPTPDSVVSLDLHHRGVRRFNVDLQFLVSLNLSGNQVESFRAIGRLPALKTLNLSHNLIQRVVDARPVFPPPRPGAGDQPPTTAPASSCLYPRLETLDLRWNAVLETTELLPLFAHNHIISHERLRSLYLHGNPVSTLHPVALQAALVQELYVPQLVLDFAEELKNGVICIPEVAEGLHTETQRKRATEKFGVVLDETFLADAKKWRSTLKAHVVQYIVSETSGGGGGVVGGVAPPGRSLLSPSSPGDNALMMTSPSCGGGGFLQGAEIVGAHMGAKITATPGMDLQRAIDGALVFSSAPGGGVSGCGRARAGGRGASGHKLFATGEAPRFFLEGEPLRLPLTEAATMRVLHWLDEDKMDALVARGVADTEQSGNNRYDFGYAHEVRMLAAYLKERLSVDGQQHPSEEAVVDDQQYPPPQVPEEELLTALQRGLVRGPTEMLFDEDARELGFGKWRGCGASEVLLEQQARLFAVDLVESGSAVFSPGDQGSSPGAAQLASPAQQGEGDAPISTRTVGRTGSSSALAHLQFELEPLLTQSQHFGEGEEFLEAFVRGCREHADSSSLVKTIAAGLRYAEKEIPFSDPSELAEATACVALRLCRGAGNSSFSAVEDEEEIDDFFQEIDELIAFEIADEAEALDVNPGSAGSAPPCVDVVRFFFRSMYLWFLSSLDLSGLGARVLRTVLTYLGGRTCNLRRLHLGGNALKDAPVDWDEAGPLGTTFDAAGSGLPCVEELCLNDNELTSLAGLQTKFPSLRRLDADSNRIADVADLFHYPYSVQLLQVSLENNFIDSLDGFAQLENVVELYLSHNLIEELRAVLALKNCARLRVLDLSGNPLCTAENPGDEQKAPEVKPNQFSGALESRLQLQGVGRGIRTEKRIQLAGSGEGAPGADASVATRGSASITLKRGFGTRTPGKFGNAGSGNKETAGAATLDITRYAFLSGTASAAQTAVGISQQPLPRSASKTAASAKNSTSLEASQMSDVALARERARNYRLYVVWHLRQLKVLDGLPIAADEGGDAKERFAGRLSMEILEEKLGPTPSCFYVRAIDLEGLKLRELGALLQDEVFPSLRELVLDDNPISSLESLGPCTKLVILKCCKTKLNDVGKLGGGAPREPIGRGGSGTATVATGDLAARGGAAHGPASATSDKTSSAVSVPASASNGGLRHSTNLQVLELRFNSIADLSQFPPLKSLRYLNLEGNDLREIGRCVFIALENLRELNLDKNKLKSVDEDELLGLVNLRELRAEDNNIRTFRLNVLVTPKLRRVLLGNNRITDVTSDMLVSQKDPAVLLAACAEPSGNGFRRGSMPDLESSRRHSTARQHAGTVNGGHTGQNPEGAAGTTSSTNLEALSILQLSFANNVCTRKPLYRAALLSRFPNLRVLDGLQLLDEDQRPLSERPLITGPTTDAASHPTLLTSPGGNYNQFVQNGPHAGTDGRADSSSGPPNKKGSAPPLPHQTGAYKVAATSRDLQQEHPAFFNSAVAAGGSAQGGATAPNSSGQHQNLTGGAGAGTTSTLWSGSTRLGGPTAPPQQPSRDLRTMTERVISPNQRMRVQQMSLLENRPGMPRTTAVHVVREGTTASNLASALAPPGLPNHWSKSGNARAGAGFGGGAPSGPSQAGRRASYPYSRSSIEPDRSAYETLSPAMNQATFLTHQAHEFSHQAQQASYNAMMYYQAAMMAHMYSNSAGGGGGAPASGGQGGAAAAASAGDAAARPPEGGAFLVTARGIEQVQKKT